MGVSRLTAPLRFFHSCSSGQADTPTAQCPVLTARHMWTVNDIHSLDLLSRHIPFLFISSIAWQVKTRMISYRSSPTTVHFHPPKKQSQEKYCGWNELDVVGGRHHAWFFQLMTDYYYNLMKRISRSQLEEHIAWVVKGEDNHACLRLARGSELFVSWGYRRDVTSSSCGYILVTHSNISSHKKSLSRVVNRRNRCYVLFTDNPSLRFLPLFFLQVSDIQAQVTTFSIWWTLGCWNRLEENREEMEGLPVDERSDVDNDLFTGAPTFYFSVSWMTCARQWTVVKDMPLIVTWRCTTYKTDSFSRHLQVTPPTFLSYGKIIISIN